MAVFFLLISALSWSLFDLTRKQLVSTRSPLALSITLNLGALPVYLVAFWLTGAETLTSGYWLPGFIAASLAALAAVGFITALKLGDIARVVPLLSMTPVISTLGAYFFLDEILTVWQWLAMIIIVVAIIGVQGGIRFVRGKPFLLMAMVSTCWGIGIVFDKMALQHAPPVLHGVIQTSIVSGLLIAFALLRQQRVIAEGSLLKVIPAMAVFVIAVIAQWTAMRDIDAGIVETVKRSIGILGAMFWGFLLFKERIKLIQIMCACVIIVCMIVILLPNLTY
ncbi:MAG: DMT family transporter [Oleibacter sp.]|nr:DMT family transporter [Thalassolituus sp.]